MKNYDLDTLLDKVEALKRERDQQANFATRLGKVAKNWESLHNKQAEAYKASLEAMTKEKDKAAELAVRAQDRAEKAGQARTETVKALRAVIREWRNIANIPPYDVTSRTLHLCAADVDEALAKVGGA